jgi:ankyrin repeat protein
MNSYPPMGKVTVSYQKLQEEFNNIKNSINQASKCKQDIFQIYRNNPQIQKQLDRLVSLKSNDGRTAIHLAVQDGNIDIAILLAHKGEDITTRINDSLLHTAAKAGHTDMINFLIYDCEVNVNIKNKYGETPLHYAAQKGLRDTVRLLISNGADVKSIAAGRLTPLHYAAKEGHIEVVRALIRSGAKIDATTSCGQTPLHLAIEKKHLEVIMELIKKTAESETEKREEISTKKEFTEVVPASLPTNSNIKSSYRPQSLQPNPRLRCNL